MMALDYNWLRQQADEVGFEHTARLDVRTIRLRDDVRAMCSANSCGAYGRNWSCPPACGELDELRRVVDGYREGLLVQTVGEIEDSFDGEGMMRAERRHKARFAALHERLIARYPSLLALSAGGCTRCERCTCPDAPCRFPELRLSSMEAYGMLVLEICAANGLGYYYGPQAIAYTGCFLLE